MTIELELRAPEITGPRNRPAFLSRIASAVDQRITLLLDGDARRWRSVDQQLSAPLADLRKVVLSGGKRLRPAFCYWAFLGAGGRASDPRLVDTCAALELLHTFALIHDDVMDASSVRHGVTTVHVDQARLHRKSSWRGDSERFGVSAGILAGDLALVYSDVLVTALPEAAARIWHELRLEMIAGQYLDLVGTASGGVDPALARRICRYKTGKYSVERPLQLGAAVAAPHRIGSLEEPLARFGRPLGEAFQLRDDLLGVFGDPSVTGKPVGEDICDGKPTLLYALAREASGPGATLIDKLYGRPDLSAEEIADIQAAFVTSGAADQVRNIIDARVDEALVAAEALPLTPAARSALGEMALFVAARDH